MAIEITFISDLNEITAIVSSFGSDDNVFTDKNFITKLQSGKIIFCCLKIDSEVYYYSLLEPNTSLTVRLNHFTTKKTSNQEFLTVFLNKCFEYGKKFTRDLFFVTLPFRVQSNLTTTIISNGYDIFERENMILHLQDVHFKKPDLSNYTIKKNISDYAKEIIEFIMIANKNQPDAEIYPDFSDYTIMEHVLGLKEPKKHHFDESSSVLLFYKEQLIGLNLITLMNTNSAGVVELAIHPDFRRRKLGYNAMIVSILALQAKNIEELLLNVRVGNPAQKVYEAVGFKKKEEQNVLRKKYIQ